MKTDQEKNGFFGFSAVRSYDRHNAEICKDNTSISYTSATVNTDQMLNLETGVVTIRIPGIYSLSFHGLSSYGSNQTGINVVQKTGNDWSSAKIILSTHSQKGFTPMSVMRLLKFEEGDEIRVYFWIEDPTNNKGCLYSGNNGHSFITTFTGILMDRDKWLFFSISVINWIIWIGIWLKSNWKIHNNWTKLLYGSLCIEFMERFHDLRFWDTEKIK